MAEVEHKNTTCITPFSFTTEQIITHQPVLKLWKKNINASVIISQYFLNVIFKFDWQTHHVMRK